MSKQQVATQQRGGQAVEAKTVQEERREAMEAFKRQLKANFVSVFQPLLPAHMTAPKFEAMVISAVLGNPDLLTVDRASLMTAVADLADLGLSVNKQMREADILVVGGKAQMRPRYEGVAKLALQSGEVIDIYAHEVYENDHFEYRLGLNKDVDHVPAEGDRGPLKQIAYCAWTSKHGIKGFEVIHSDRIDRARKASKSYQAWEKDKSKTSPWITDEAQMIRKTAIHAASHFMPKSTESDKFMRALAMSTDSTFDSEDHVGVPSEVPVLSSTPAPTRASTKEAMERIRKEQVAREGQFRDAMGGEQDGAEPDGEEPAGDPRDAQEQPKKDEPKPEPQKEEQQPQQDPQGQETIAFDAVAFQRMFLGSISRATTDNQLTALQHDYKVELKALLEAEPAKHAEIGKAIGSKRASLKRR